ncbi:enhancer of split malpha protein [Lucilia cuprina]|uniref:enhancer of split malpha protein n=1 Tax=Lucilia cuprina TaxID=7375 RepID=UPI001F062F25|nr:enhancer of split malpha protein [Lucilia cuprina]
MCQQMQQLANSNNSTATNNKMKTATYSIKKVLKTFFKKQHKSSSTETFEDLDNLRNMQAEQQQYFNEMEDNSANEKLSVMAYEEEQIDQEDIYVPVRFARTEAGTFFWTTNLQPVTSTIMPAVDEDLLQPAYCYSNNQYPIMQFQDRWAQA